MWRDPSQPKIVHRGKDWFACHKPAGWTVYGDKGNPDAPPDCASYFQKKLAQKTYPVHRLDKDTCGLVVMGLTPLAADKISELFSGNKVRKEYLAIVVGTTSARGDIRAPLKENKGKRMLRADTSFVRLAHTVILNGLELSLLRITPKTGRYHQIRRHLRGIGHPILGDPQYGNRDVNEQVRRHFNVKRTLLNASRIKVPYPASSPVEVKTNPDADFKKVQKKFGSPGERRSVSTP